MRVRSGKVSELLKPDEEILVVEIGNEHIIWRINPLELLDKIPYLSEEEAERLGLEAKKWARRTR
ncbi:MAG: hypothetical protein J7L11_05765 [Thermoprotei archaeon]|nr:hypothetical protein [Thermoprotei archaeon]